MATCFACDQAATYRCPRCGQLYCPDHGQEYCAQCLHPASIAPSSGLFRASLLAFLIASVLALWLLIRPPGLPGDSSSAVRPLASPTPTATSTATVTPTTTPETTATATPTVTPPPVPQVYIVQEGDNLFDIATSFGVSVDEIAALNGISDPSTHLLHVGDELQIPALTP